jgi:putative ABC transport system permease protein
MKYLPYILRHLRRNWIRTSTTVLGMAMCVFLFCVLQTIIQAVDFGLGAGSANRLVTRHAVGLTNNMPVTYRERIKHVPGVKRVAVSNWFAGMQGSSADGTPDFKNFFPNFAVDSEEYFGMHPEFVMSPEEKSAYMADRRGAVIGEDLAKKYNWKVGSTFQLESIIPPYRVGKPFEFQVRAIYHTDKKRYPSTQLGMMFFHYAYLYEGTKQRAGVGTYNVEIDDAEKAPIVSKTIDEIFANSDAETKTETEAAFAASFVSLAGNLALLLNLIGTAVAFTILLVTANTMSMAVRERRTEIAVLKTLGFPSWLVMGLVLSEALLIGVLGGGMGLILARGMISILPNLPFIGDVVAGFPDFGLSVSVGLLGLAFAVLLSTIAGFFPAMVAFRARITDMLRTV